MTKLLLAFLMGLLFLVPLYSAHPHAVNGDSNHNVEIPDTVLRGIVETRLTKMPGEAITATEMATLDEVVKADQNIHDLTGLEHATNLNSIRIGRNRIRFPTRTRTTTNTVSDLSPLTNLPKLTTLNFTTHRITDISPLSTLPMLADLTLSSNAELADLSPLQNLTSLKNLYLDRCNITDITAIGTLTNLRVLEIGVNRNLQDISPLTNLSDLRTLKLNTTAITAEGLSAVLPALEGARRQEPGITYWANLDITNTEVADLSVLDSIPDGVFIHNLHLQFMGTTASGTRFLLLKDLTPLVDLMNKGKVVSSDTNIELRWNFRLDYPSLYEDIPTLLGTIRRINYLASTPSLEKESPTGDNYEGAPGSRATFVVRGVNNTPFGSYPLERTRNRTFNGVPVTWKVTAPDGTVTQTQTPTGNDGLSSVTITLGNDGETHTVEAIVPEKMNSDLSAPHNMNLSHSELKETFTATAVAPLVIKLTLDNATHTDIQWTADVSGRPLPGSYAYYYKKSADRAWIRVTNLGHRARRFSFVHSDLQPGTSYDFQLFGLRGEDRIESNVLTARTLSRTGTRPPVDPPVRPPVDPPNRPPVFRSAATVSIAENTTAIVTIIAEDPDADDVITGYAITGGADASSFEIGGTRTPVDMLRFKAAPDFEMPGSAANSNVYTLILTATSGVGDRELTATQTLTITVTDVDEPIDPPVDTPNNPPVFRSASAVNVLENTTAVITVVAEDPDVDDAITGYAVTGGADQALFEIGGTRSPVDMLRFKAAPDFETPKDANKDNVYTLILTATSGIGDRELTATQTLTITVTDVDEPIDPPIEPPVDPPVEPANSPPVFRSAAVINVSENTTAVATIIAEDPDAGDAITGYAITGGADRALFEISGTGSPVDLLRFRVAPDFEMPGSTANSNVYTLILTATSGIGDRELTATQTLTITVTDVDEPVDPPVEPPVDPPVEPANSPPVFRSASAVSVPENTTRVVTVVAEDPDAEDAITGYAITGGADRTLFVLSGTRAPANMLRFRVAPDFEMPGSAANSNVYTIILTATSGVGNRELMATQTLTINVTDVDESVDPPVVGDGGAGGGASPIPLGTQSFIFNEIGNFSDDTNDWIELKNVCNTPLDLSEWQIRLITTYNIESGAEIDVVSLPDFVLPVQGVLLITNTGPSDTNLASGLNIATGARQKGARHLYFVALDLKLPSTPFLLILQRTTSADIAPTIVDVAGNYFWPVLPYGSDVDPFVYPFSDTSDLTEMTAPLTQFGAWQRQHLEHPGYLAAAWVSSGYHAHLGYDRHAPARLCLGTPGYRLNPSPAQPVTHRLVFNEVRNASDDINDWIELKNVCGTDIHLKDWEISIVTSTGETAREEVDIVSFPDYTLPMGGVLLITNTDPEETVVAGGLNIATGKRQQGAQHLYFVAERLKLPSTPFLLILRHVQEKDRDIVKTIEDVAGNYFWALLSNDIEVYSFPSHPTESLVQLTDFGAWQRQHLEDPGYLAAAWVSSGYHGHIGYDRHALASMCLGTPGYRRDFSPVLPVVSRVVFNKVRNAFDDTNDWIELKNICGTDVNLRDWEISIVRSIGVNADQDVDIVSFPDYILPSQGLLLITNIDPSKTWLTSGLNIAASEQQTNAQHPYLVAPDLKLPDTPYLLILRHARGKNGTPESIEDVAGNYFRMGNNTEVWPLANTHRPRSPVVQLSWGGTWQRKDIRERGYLAAAWTEVQSQYDPIASDTLPVSRVVFNKVRNAFDNSNDWVELKNIYGTDVRLTDWEISIVASIGENADQDVAIVSFPDYTLPVGGVLLITNTAPDEKVITDGLNITPGARQQQNARHPYLVALDLKLPSTPYLLILRHARGRNGTPESIEDVAGNYFRSTVHNDISTDVWPLADTRRPNAPVVPLSEVGNWQRKDAIERGYLSTAWTVNRSPPGISDTPNALDNGQNLLFAPNANTATVVFNPTLPDEVRITELMSETKGPSEALPQWIELYNASQTPVDLNDWQLGVETRTDGTHLHAILTLKSFSLPPKQTVILVTGQGERSDALPTERVYDLSAVHREEFNQQLKDTIIGTEGFSLKLLHPTGRIVDSCGNLDGDKDTDDQPTWTLPDTKTPQGHRFSLLRRFDGDVLKGTKVSGWMSATTFAIGVNAYYGHPTDIATPCSLHQIVPGTSPTVALSISEIMFETKSRTLPQWIELYNPSFTDAVKLKDYQLIVETRQEGKHHQIVMTLEAFDVLPNQIALLVTARGQYSKHLTDNRIYNLLQRHPEAFSPLLNRSRLLSSEGFLIQLSDSTGNIVDTIGNLDGYPHTKDTSAWTLPLGETKDGARASLRRLYKKRLPLDGRQAKAWVSTADVPPKIITYYGDASDVGNPMYRKGTPLPVTLSSFKAQHTPDGVIINWTTESELNNAGFYIYRSQTKDGEFKVVNPTMVQGAGTTSERNEYTWTDTTAKPNTVYYYQIEDISHAGERKRLATVRLRGLVSARGKLVTRWADLK